VTWGLIRRGIGWGNASKRERAKVNGTGGVVLGGVVGGGVVGR